MKFTLLTPVRSYNNKDNVPIIYQCFSFEYPRLEGVIGCHFKFNGNFLYWQTHQMMLNRRSFLDQKP